MKCFSSKREIWGVVILLHLFFSISSCAQPVETVVKSGRLRVILESAYGVPLEMRAYAEGSDGQFLTGALVSVQFPQKEVTVLNYKPTEGCFYKIWNSASQGIYSFSLSSIGLTEDIIIEILHNPLIDRPVLNVLESVDSVSALKGEVIPADQEISIGWSEALGANSYSIQINSGSQSVFRSSTVVTTLSIPGGSLPVGALTIQIKAQFLVGDPTYRQAEYYSVSHAASSTFQFTTK